MTYSADGQLAATFPVTKGEYLIGWLPVTSNGQDYVAVQYIGGSWKLFDLRTGQSQPLSAPPQPYSLLAPDAPPVARVSDSPDGRSYVLQLLDGQGQPVGEPVNAGFGLDRIMIAPDGRAVAFTRFNPETSVYQQQIEIWRDGRLAAVPNTDTVYYAGSFVWGPLTWRVESAAVQNSGSTQPDFDCPGALPPRLAVGGQGQVIPGGGVNNLRAQPSRSAAKIGEIPENAVFSVEDGPACADGLVWWQVNYNGQSGWTVEGQDGTYYLEPVG
jgi:hypothetical protein